MRADAKKLVLVAEDDDTLRYLTAKQLSKLGYTAHFARNGREAVDMIFGGASYDVVLMDLSMPVLDGIEAIKEIRKRELDERRRRIPIVAVTAYSERQLATDSGADDFVMKPLMIDVLSNVLLRWGSAYHK